MPEFNVTFRVKCGDLTCASERGTFCEQLGARRLFTVPYCLLFRTNLGEINGWVARCAECLAATPPPPDKE